ncbi:hypothetical protein BDQ17DRAFT_1432324 [Cyathus striatus]|nr:hypothetical protein BDQ17DRAFT_1432324 [Cyathus striatus]
MDASKFISLLSITAFVGAETLAKRQETCSVIGKIDNGDVSRILSCSSTITLAKNEKLTDKEKAELSSLTADCIFEAEALGVTASI